MTEPTYEASQACRNCKFWEPTEDTDGVCRRFPPVLDTATLHWDGKIAKREHNCLVHANEDMMSCREKSYSWVQPVTQNCDWCGEFQPQPKETA